MFFSGAAIPCSVCDSAVATITGTDATVDVTLSPTVRMLRSWQAGERPAQFEAHDCSSHDSTLEGRFSLRCVQSTSGAIGTRMLATDSSNCTRKAYAATHGFSYNQDPSWQDDAARPETSCGNPWTLVDTFNPLFRLPVQAVGKCGLAAEFSEWARAAFVGPAWTDGSHRKWGSLCVECSVEAGYEGGSAQVFFYSGTDCNRITFVRSAALVVDQCSHDTLRDARYTATCDVDSVGACPRPPAGMVVSKHTGDNAQRASTCMTEPEVDFKLILH